MIFLLGVILVVAAGALAASIYVLRAERRWMDESFPSRSEVRPMTFHLFKTFKVGPVRVTASRSGLSTSVGGKRARVGTRSDGRRRASVKMPGGWRLRKG